MNIKNELNKMYEPDVMDYKVFLNNYVDDRFEEIERRLSILESRGNTSERVRAVYHRKSEPWTCHFNGAKQRCTNEKHPSYPRYGGRGIKLLMDKNDFKTLWLRDGAEKMNVPSVDRINNDGHYEIWNCRFIEHYENTTRLYSRPILRMSANGEVKIFKNASVAAKEMGKPRANALILKYLHGKEPTAYGYHWEYADSRSK